MTTLGFRSTRHLTPLSPDRAATLGRLLAELDGWLAPRPLADLTATDLQSFLDAKLVAGFHASTLRRQLKMLRAHFRRLATADEGNGAVYAAMRSVELPPDTTHQGPHPYTLDEIDGL